MKLRELSLILTGLFILFCFYSCSFHIEKRRYRKGYHVQVIGNSSVKTTQKHEVQPFIPFQSSEKKSIVDDSVQYVKKKDIVPIPARIHSKSVFVSQHLNKPTGGKSRDRKFILKKNPKHINHAKTANSVKTRRIIAWVLGGIAITMVIIYLISGFIWGGPFGAFIYLVGLPIAALFLAIVALLVRYVGLKKELEGKKEDPKPKDKKFLDTTFYLAIVSLALIIVSLVFAVLVKYLAHPIAYIVNAFTSIPGLILAIIVIILGGIANRIEPSFKSKFSIILGVITMVLAILSILLAFLILG